MAESKQLLECLESIPAPQEIRLQIAENLHQRQLLRQLLKLSEQRQKTREISR